MLDPAGVDGAGDVEPDHHRRARCGPLACAEDRTALGVEDLERADDPARIALVDLARTAGVPPAQLGGERRQPFRGRRQLGAVGAPDRVRRHLGEVEAVDERGDVEPGAPGDDGARSGAVEPLEAASRCRQPVGDGERLARIAEVEQMAAHPVQLRRGSARRFRRGARGAPGANRR